MFGRATIRLGIGPHSSFVLFFMCDNWGVQIFCRLIWTDIVNFIDIVSMVSTICRYNIAQLIIGPQLTAV